MEKLKKLLDKAYFEGKFPKYLSQMDIFILTDIYKGLKNGINQEFINQSVHDTLEKCGIKMKVSGIGWVAYI